MRGIITCGHGGRMTSVGVPMKELDGGPRPLPIGSCRGERVGEWGWVSGLVGSGEGE